MNPIAFEGMTGVLGKPSDWNDERDGSCDSLPVRREEEHFLSVWKPTLKERFALIFGWNVCLAIRGKSHPPVAINVIPTCS